MKTIIKTAIFALTLVAGAGAGQAQPGFPKWHFPYKGAPYATQAEPAQQAAAAQVLRHAKHSAVYGRTAGKSKVIR